ncbi:hypothetical protein [Streptomyces himalayensis]|uniref:Uncharacterized protein n=1 Tax=Streptomyces himalayensis subsp. himalayensis TaxID=2756131 RepID=A0A7W0IDC1_9ACTN|nr:hypothetical protein [Streptomyces himalayensis]MBA2951635.1 hypothetical protein [Streptomyces himalayensis subsp. himalayensis]
MTTATKTLPPHGTYARARGNHRSGQERCYCAPCRAAERAYTKHQRYLKATGRGLLVDAAPVAAHLRMLMDNGDALTIIAEQIGRPRSTLENIISGRSKRVRRQTADQIMAMKPGNAIAANRSVPAVGSIRRIRALTALGHSLKAVAAAGDIEDSTASYLLNGHSETIRYELAQRVKVAYRKLGESRGTSVRNLKRAAREMWAPPGAWDDEAIDDPNAAPDWTGCCGTDRGYWVHKRQSLPMCLACEHAHAGWLAAHAHLDGKTRNQLKFAARNAAATREADLAADARELMWVSGLSVEQAAERLSVTKVHLQQALKRHPEMKQEVAA